MPKVEIDKEKLNNLLLEKLNDEDFEKLLETAKAELKEIIDNSIYKIEFNDTNRPDLWSTEGLARHINTFLKKKKYNYSFFKNKPFAQIIVDKKLKNIRPYITAFIAKNINIDEKLLKELINKQERFSENYGRKRKDIAIGIYKSKRIKFPVYFKAVKPYEYKFTPLGFDNKIDLSEIIEKHPKGIEYGSIVKEFEYFPLIVDSKNEVLSFPPIINSREIGEVEIGDDEIFIEMTGTNLRNLLLVSNIFACDLNDIGAEIVNLEIVYPYETDFGQRIITPFDFNESIEVSNDDIEKLIGEKVNSKLVIENLKKMGFYKLQILSSKKKINRIKVSIPNYRQDIMHPVDIAEDFLIAYGYSNIEPEMPKEFTVGQLNDLEIFSDKVRSIVIGVGFQEIISNILNSKENIYYKMSKEEGTAVEILNPMSESYNLLRNSIIPSLLEVEQRSAKAEYPHRIFEVGEIVVKDENENYGTKTLLNLGLLSANSNANFSEMESYINTIFYYIGLDNFKKEERDFKFLIPGRSAEIICNNQIIGIIGEIHPEILLKWDINMPVVCAEINLNSILNILKYE